MPRYAAAQPSLFEPAPVEAAPAQPDLDFARRHLNSLLWTLRRAEFMPWPEHEVRKWESLFPALAADLPDDEAEELNATFIAEVARLRAV